VCVCCSDRRTVFCHFLKLLSREDILSSFSLKTFFCSSHTRLASQLSRHIHLFHKINIISHVVQNTNKRLVVNDDKKRLKSSNNQTPPFEEDFVNDDFVVILWLMQYYSTT
jgi:hypothetical protein